MVGKEVYDGVLTELQRMVKAEGFASVKAAHARAIQAGSSESALWHETLAYLAEISPRHGLIRRLVHAIKRFLRSLGVPVGQLTEQDLVSLVQVAAFKEGLKGEGVKGGMLASKRLPRSLNDKRIGLLDDLSIGIAREGDGEASARYGLRLYLARWPCQSRLEICLHRDTSLQSRFNSGWPFQFSSICGQRADAEL